MTIINFNERLTFLAVLKNKWAGEGVGESEQPEDFGQIVHRKTVNTVHLLFDYGYYSLANVVNSLRYIYKVL